MPVRSFAVRTVAGSALAIGFMALWPRLAAYSTHVDDVAALDPATHHYDTAGLAVTGLAWELDRWPDRFPGAPQRPSRSPSAPRSS